jgi:transcriptional regulator with XRE-family HTH domain
MTTATPFALPEAVLTAISKGTPVIRAYREHLGYTVEDIAVTSGLTISEVEKIESGHRFEKGYRDRIARALGLPEGIFDEISDIPDAA